MVQSPGLDQRLYLDDLQVGQRFTSGTHAIDEAQIKAFARQFDPQPFHLDEEAAKGSLFGRLVASGWHTAAITMRLLTESVPIANGVIGAGGEEITPSRSRPERGRVLMRSETRNQRDEIVQTLTSRLVVLRRPGTS
jgi:acyl dehydratase